MEQTFKEDPACNRCHIYRVDEDNIREITIYEETFWASLKNILVFLIKICLSLPSQIPQTIKKSQNSS